MNTGQGSATVPRWYFKRDTRECSPFHYKGLLGNANNFLTKDECERECPSKGSIIKNLYVYGNNVFVTQVL